MELAQESIDEWNTWNSNSLSDGLFIKSLKAKGFGVEEIARILDVIQSTCNRCWDSDTKCHCTNDE